MKRVTLKKAKAFYEEATKAYDKLKSCFKRREAQNELDVILECFNKIGNLWNHLEIKGDYWWLKGDQCISEALGNTIRYWNTDIVDKSAFCDYLVEILGYPELTESGPFSHYLNELK